MHAVALTRTELLTEDREGAVAANLRADISVIVAVIGGLSGAEVEVEQVGFQDVELADDVEVEGFDGFAGHWRIEGIDEVLDEQQFCVADEGGPSAEHLIVGETRAGLADDAETVKQVEEDECQEYQGNGEKLQNNDLLVSVLAVLHLLKFLLDHHHAVHAASAHLALPENI